jgi:hypothetical protein
MRLRWLIQSDVWNPLRDLKIYCPALLSALSRLFYVLTADSFTAPATSDYELSEQAIHHEIGWFFVTTFRSIGTSPHRGIVVRIWVPSLIGCYGGVSVVIRRTAIDSGKGGLRNEKPSVFSTGGVNTLISRFARWRELPDKKLVRK